MNDSVDAVAAVRGWLTAPAAGTGIHLADEADGWEYRGYPELAGQAWSIAGLLRAGGLGSGDRACVIMPTGFPCFAAFYAVWACGGVFTPVAPPMFGDMDQIVAHIAGILRQAAPKLVVTAPEFEALVRRAAAEAGRTDEPLVVDAANLPPAPEIRELGAASEVALLQFTSGSSGAPRGVKVSWENLAANIGLITRHIDLRPGETIVSWLPLYHDMGLIGAFLNAVTNQCGLYIMRPDQFVRDPARWLRAMAHAQHGPSPSFALGYAAHRVRAEEIADLDLSGWRSLVIGSEPVELADLQSFAELAGRQGFSTKAYTLAYGLAEATLMVSSSRRGRPITALRLDNPNLRFGQQVPVLEQAILDDAHRIEGAGWITGLGYSTPESTVIVADDEGRELPDGVLGEMVVLGDSVALGYSGEPGPGSTTRFSDARVYTGDSGFLYNGEVFVLGRMGTSLKVRGRSVFMEDIESRVAQETGLTKGKLAAVGISEAGVQGVALFAETAPGDWIAEARKIIRGHLGPAQTVQIVTGPRGLIRRTSSGKPRRRHMWQLLRDGELSGAVVHTTDEPVTEAPQAQSADDDAPHPAERNAAHLAEQGTPHLGMPIERVRSLFEAAADAVSIPPGAAVLFEGSLAEGFGNAGSDIDFLVVTDGDEDAPTMPTVLFADGRRVEVRSRSAAQIRKQFEQVASAPDEDSLNRCQRFLRATVVQAGEVDIDGLRSLIPYPDFSTKTADWWALRAAQALRYAIALRALGEDDEAFDWAADGLRQAMKSWAARQGETYIESKWLPRQLDRIGAHELIDRFQDLAAAATALPFAEQAAALLDRTARHSGPASSAGARPDAASAVSLSGGIAELPASVGNTPPAGEAAQRYWTRVLDLAAELGVPGIADDAHQVVFARRSGVTTWAIGGRLHVLRDDQDVFVLSDEAARAWRQMVFRHSVRDVLARASEDIRAEVAEFVRLGFVGLQWRGAEVIEPALAMLKPLRPQTPVASPVAPGLGLTGLVRDGAIATLAALPAKRFTECGLNLVWSNIVLENAREDLVGAVKDGQGGVADIAAHRLLMMSVRVLLSAFGVSPLPGDVAPGRTVVRLLPAHTPERGELLAGLEAVRRVRFSELIAEGDPLEGLAVLDDFVALVRRVAGEPRSTGEFPASFDSREQWQRTLAIGYDWLRLAGYLDTDVPLDEARDLLASGGQQPHLRESEQS